MNYSIANEKYRKYKTLQKKHPRNATYTYKVQKYNELMSKFGQKGGNEQMNQMYGTVPNQQFSFNQNQGQLNKSNPLVETMDRKNLSMNQTNMQNYNGSASQAKTSELVRKIQNMVEYAKQNGMKGGSQKKSSNTTTNSGAKNTIKGIRNMKGGVKVGDLDFSKENLFDNPLEFEEEEKQKTIEQLTAEQQNVTSAIEKSVNAIINKKNELEQKIAELDAEKKRLEQDKKIAEETMAEKLKEIEELNTAKKALEEALREYEEVPEELGPSISEVKADLENKIDSLNKELAQEKQTIEELNKKLATLQRHMTNATNALEKYQSKYNEKSAENTGLLALIEEYKKNEIALNERLRVVLTPPPPAT
jgi:colicin import membrane protein